MQDAKFGDLYEEFPPVLQLHLKRFEYDFDRDIRVKVRPSPSNASRAAAGFRVKELCLKLSEPL